MRLIGSSMQTNLQQQRSQGCWLRKASAIATKIFLLAAIAIVLVYQLQTLFLENLLASSSQEEPMGAPRKKSAPIGERNEIISSPIFFNSSSPQAQARKCVYETIAKANSMSSSNNSVLRNTKDQHRRQIIYIHPGPAKIATTTIQQLLTDHQKQLNSDNIFYLGKTMPKEKWKCDFPHLADCLMYKQYRPEPEHIRCREIIVEQLNEYYSKGVDVILSEEVFGIMFNTKKRGTSNTRGIEGLEILSNILRSNNWEIRLLIGYRPYFDYVKSLYSQKYNARGKKMLLNWPGQGGKHIPPMHDELFEDEWPFTDELIDLFKAHVDVDIVEVLDITQNNHRGDLSERLYCDLLKEAQQTCSARKASLDDSEVRKNVAMSHDYDRIATAAATKGLVDTNKFTRSTITSRVKKFVEVTNNDSNNTTLHNLPLLCPTKDNIDILHNMSLAKEMTVFPERQPNWETTGLFETMMKKKSLCSIDTDKVLEKEEWKKFFQLFRKSRTL
jgi:hypothetical protein